MNNENYLEQILHFLVEVQLTHNHINKIFWTMIYWVNFLDFSVPFRKKTSFIWYYTAHKYISPTTMINKQKQFWSWVWTTVVSLFWHCCLLNIYFHSCNRCSCHYLHKCLTNSGLITSFAQSAEILVIIYLTLSNCPSKWHYNSARENKPSSILFHTLNEWSELLELDSYLFSMCRTSGDL